MRKKSFGLFMAVTVTVSLLASLFPYDSVQAAKAYEFEVGMDAGYHDQVLAGCTAPFHFTIKNNNSYNFEGKFQVIVPSRDSSENILYEENITLAPNGEKSLDFNCYVPDLITQVNVRITDKKGKVLTSTLKSVNVLDKKETVRIGVLSDDYTALAYMDRQEFLSNSDITFSLYQFDIDTFPTDFNLLDMIDVIVISDFSTDILSDEQIDALDMWVNNGGFLIVGTGTTASKTLSGLNNRVFTVDTNGKESVSNCLGMDIFDYLKIYEILNRDIGTGYRPDTNDFYAYTPYNDEYLYYVDKDGDGVHESCQYEIGTHYDSVTDSYITNFNMVVRKEYEYLFQDDAFYVDPITGEYHYKYYDERFCVLPANDYDFDYFMGIKCSDKERTDMYCYRAYCDVYGYDPKWELFEIEQIRDVDQVEAAFDSYWGADYEEFVNHYMYCLYRYEDYYEDIRPDIYQLMSTDEVYNPITCDVLNISLENENSALRIEGLNTATGQTFPLVEVCNHGKGFIGVSSIDFTKNPIPKASYSGQFFRNVVESTIGEIVYDEAESYTRGYSRNYYPDVEGELYSSLSSAPSPAAFVYLLLLGIYIISMFVVYFIYRKTKHTFKLWKVYSIMSLSVALVVYAFSFSTKTLKLTANTLSLYFPNGSSINEIDYSTIVVPKAKEYEVTLADKTSLNMDYLKSDYHYYGYSSSVDYDSYSMAFKNTAEGNQFTISDKVALQSQKVQTESVCNSNGSLIVSVQTPVQNGDSFDADNVFITNDFSVEMQDVFILVTTSNYGKDCYYFKSIKPGEKFKLTDGEYEPGLYVSSYYSDDLKDMFYEYKGRNSMFYGFLLGDLFSPYKKNKSKLDGLKFIFTNNEYNDENDYPSILVTAFPKAKMGNDVFLNKKMNLNRTEIVVENVKYDTLTVK